MVFKPAISSKASVRFRDIAIELGTWDRSMKGFLGGTSLDR